MPKNNNNSNLVLEEYESEFSYQRPKSNLIISFNRVAFIFFMLGIFFPKTLFLPNKLWFKFGMILGAVIAPIVMSLVYFFTVFPIGIIMRLFGKDLLSLKINKSKKSYWIKRKEPVKTMKNQF